MDFAALWVSLRLAAVTTAVLLLVGTPLALWLAGRLGGGVLRVRGDVRDGWLRGTSARWVRLGVEACVALPLVLPPTVLGFGMLVGLGPLTAVGRGLTRVLGHTVAFSFAGLVLASCVYSLPFAVQPLVAGFRAVPRAQVEAMLALGATRWETARMVVLPMARGSFVAAAVLTFAHTLGEFGVVLMVGGDVPGVTRTLSIAIFDKVQEGSYGAAGVMSVALMAVSFVALVVVYGRRQWVEVSG